MFSLHLSFQVWGRYSSVAHYIPITLSEKLYLNNLILYHKLMRSCYCLHFSDRVQGLTIMQQLPSLGKQASPLGVLTAGSERKRGREGQAREREARG